MVSQLSSRLLNGYGTTVGASNRSTTGSVDSRSNDSNNTGRDVPIQPSGSIINLGTTTVDTPPVTHVGSNNSIIQGRLASLLGPSSLSGYTADQEGRAATHGAPPPLIDLNLQHKRRAASDEQVSAKRQKMQEMNYNASNVRQDLEKAGMRMPTVRVSRPRAITFARLNMSGIQLLTSKAVASSPFLTKADTGKHRDVMTDFGNVYQECIDTYRPYYTTGRDVGTETATLTRNGRGNGSGMDSDSGQCDTDSTSSVSDTESDDSQSATMPDITARLDDSLSKRSERQNHGNSNHGITFHRNKSQGDSKANGTVVPTPTIPSNQNKNNAPTKSITLEQALDACTHPRLVTLSSPPYLVVHANAAFGRVLQSSPSATLGQPLGTLLGPTHGTSLVLPSCAAASDNGRHVTAQLRRQQQQLENGHDDTNNETTPPVAGQLHVVAVMASTKRPQEGETTSNVTHFAVDLAVGEDGVGQEQMMENMGIASDMDENSSNVGDDNDGREKSPSVQIVG